MEERGELMEPKEKPPLGLRPRDVLDEPVDNVGRISEILGAMKRYMDAGRVIPTEWSLELYRLLLVVQIGEKG
jgi:hypothetical protein